MADRSPLAWAFIRAMQPGGLARNRVRDLDIRLGADLGPFADALAAVVDQHLAGRGDGVIGDPGEPRSELSKQELEELLARILVACGGTVRLTEIDRRQAQGQRIEVLLSQEPIGDVTVTLRNERTIVVQEGQER